MGRHPSMEQASMNNWPFGGLSPLKYGAILAEPPWAYKMRSIVEALTPRAFRCELFARESWADNEVWGNESAKFDGSESAEV